MSSSIATMLIVIGLWLGLALSCCGSARSNSSATRQAKYQVSGTGLASLTYSNAQGGTEQKEVQLPWSTSFAVRDGAFLYLSAQNKEEHGSITVDILVDRQILKTSTSEGGYTIASASYSCCD